MELISTLKVVSREKQIINYEFFILCVFVTAAGERGSSWIG